MKIIFYKILFYKLSYGFISLTFLLALNVQAQVRLIQWSDVHSTLKTLPQQIFEIDQKGKEFLLKNPKGEVVIVVLGDYTSMNTLSQEDGGWLSFEALEILKKKGYTLVFVPGNHDAFDWTVKIDGAELFIQQMAFLNQLGIPILAGNMLGVKEPLKSYLSESYELKTLKPKTKLVGLTLESLITKGNLTDKSSKKIMKSLLSYENYISQKLNSSVGTETEALIMAVHHGHHRMKSVSEYYQSQQGLPKLKSIMAADDHLVAAYWSSDVLITDGGSHGSFNIIDYDKDGKISRVEHEDLQRNFNKDSLKDNDIKSFALKVQKILEDLNSLWAKPLVYTNGVSVHKMHLKKSRQALGDALSESLVAWVKDQLWFGYLKDQPIIAMVNSSSYRLEQEIEEGSVTEFTIRDMYPYFNEATVFRMTGLEISKLFFELRSFYSKEDSKKYTPQLNLNVREYNGKLQILQTSDNQWKNIENNKSYLLALDGWLSTHRFGQSFRIPKWINKLTEHSPISTKPYQDILVDYLPDALVKIGLASYDFPTTSSENKMCSVFLN